MTGNSYSVFNAMVDIVASPGKALDEIKLHTSWLWWPLLISILLGVGLMVYYYGWIFRGWLRKRFAACLLKTVLRLQTQSGSSWSPSGASGLPRALLW